MIENKKANVFLSVNAQSKNQAPEAPTANEIVELGTLAPSELIGYAYKLTNQQKLPDDSCLSEFAVNERKNHQIKLTKKSDNGEAEESCYNELSMCIVPQMTKKECLASNEYQCLRFILIGKCQDPFIINNIGKKFLPNIYNKQH